jgi:hypothetical protein
MYVLYTFTQPRRRDDLIFHSFIMDKPAKTRNKNQINDGSEN